MLAGRVLANHTKGGKSLMSDIQSYLSRSDAGSQIAKKETDALMKKSLGHMGKASLIGLGIAGLANYGMRKANQNRQQQQNNVN